MSPSVQFTTLCRLYYNTHWTRVGSLALPSLNTRLFRCTSQPHYVSCQNTHYASVLCLLITANIALTSHSTVCSRCVHVYNIDIHNRKCSSGGEVQSGGTKHSKILKIKNSFIQGHDTTTSGISFTLWALAKHPDVQVSRISLLPCNSFGLK